MELLLKMLDLVESRIEEANSEEVQNGWIMAHLYFIICYVVSLRENEGFLFDLESLRYY